MSTGHLSSYPPPPAIAWEGEQQRYAATTIGPFRLSLSRLPDGTAEPGGRWMAQYVVRAASGVWGSLCFYAGTPEAAWTLAWEGLLGWIGPVLPMVAEHARLLCAEDAMCAAWWEARRATQRPGATTWLEAVATKDAAIPAVRARMRQLLAGELWDEATVADDAALAVAAALGVPARDPYGDERDPAA